MRVTIIMDRKKEERVILWNNFCDVDSKLQDEINDLLESKAGRDAVEGAIKKIVAKKQRILDNFAEKMLLDGSPEEAIWYLERSTKLIHLFQDFIEREFGVRCPEIKPPWVRGLHILYNKLREAKKTKREAVRSKVLAEFKVDEDSVVQATDEIFQVLKRSYEPLWKRIAEDNWSHIANKSLSLVMGEKVLLFDRLAKGIADSTGRQIHIQPIVPDLGVESRMLTAEEGESKSLLLKWLGKGPKVTMQRHFIFYKPCPGDIEIEMFRIAHELGHCALHWPLDPAKRKLDHSGKIPEAGANVYAVEFSEKEENEADAFACLVLIGGQRKWIEGHEDSMAKDFIVKKFEEYARKKLLHRF